MTSNDDLGSADPTWTVLVDTLASALAAAPTLERGHPSWRFLHEWLCRRASLIIRQYEAPIEAEDIVQDVLMKLQSNNVRRRLLAARSFEGYLTVLIRNRILDQMRMERAELRRTTDLRFASDTVQDQPLPHEEVVALQRAFARLGPDDRKLLRLRFWEDRSIASIADELRIKYSTAAVRLFRLLRRLKDQM